MKHLVKIIILLFAVNFCYSQEVIEPKEINIFNSENRIRVIQNPELREYLEIVAGLNKKRDGFWGYRVKIFAESGRRARTNANTLRVNFNSQQDSLRAYIVYLDPNFEVHVGDFRTRFDAVSILSKLSDDYPHAYIIRTIINYPEL